MPLDTVDGRVHTNGLENFWSLLKRGISGTYVSVEPFHLFRYLDEQSFRYNNRKDMTDADRFSLASFADRGKAAHLCGGDWQGGCDAFLILCAGSAGSGSPLRLPRLCSFFSIKFSFDFRVRHS
jgi:hypothetical protein